MADTWPSIPVLVMRGKAPTPESAMLLLQNLLLENEELVAVGQLIINKYIQEYNFVDREYEKPLVKNKKAFATGCKSVYHASPCAKKSLWMRSVCYDCEQLHFNWERAGWPRLSVLERHVSTELCKILRLHFTTKLYHKLVAYMMDASMDLPLDQLSIRFSVTKIAPRQLIPVIGLEAAKDVQELRRLKFFPMIHQRVRGLVSLGYAKVPKNFCSRRGRIFGGIVHHHGPFLFTDIYKRIVNVALRDPFVLKLAAPFKSRDSVENLTHSEILQRILDNKPIFGSLKICTTGNSTALDSRGHIFLDLIHLASLNPQATLSPIDALHFSADPDLQQQLEAERLKPWQLIQKPNPALVTIINIMQKGKRPK